MLKIICILSLAVLVSSSSISPGSDGTLVPEAAGPKVVEATIARIEASCIFDDDKVFMRRLSFVESNDGLKSDTFRDGYYGGIWQVDEEMYDQTKDTTLSQLLLAINAEFAIDWKSTTWDDLLKPLYSGLAARLYIEKVSGNVDIPRDLEEQAGFWKLFYRPQGDTAYFIEASNMLELGCQKSKGLDMVFVIDGSGSIGSVNFANVLQFVEDTVNAYEIGLDETRVALIQYSNLVRHEFNLNTYNTKEQVIDAIRSKVYMGGGTDTFKALDAMVVHTFQEANGARPLSEGHPRVAIVMTDGQSSNEVLTVAAAQRAHNESINMLAIGVGNSLNQRELEAIASDPKCLNLFHLGFDDIDSLHYAIERRACDAPVILIPGQNGTDIGGGDQNCKLQIPPEGATTKLVTYTGSSTFYVATNTYPSESYYEYKAESVPGKNGVMYIGNSDGVEKVMFCNIQGGDNETDGSIGLKPGDRDWCRSEPCLNGGECADQGEHYICICPPGFMGTYCEDKEDPCSSTPCKNDGECVRQDGGFICNCLPGFVGPLCETPECELDPCVHGQSYCVCDPGYTGPNCDEVIQEDECFNCGKNNPCTKENIDIGRFYFASEDPAKFVQCSEWGQCFLLDCPPGLVWDRIAYTCNYP